MASERSATSAGSMFRQTKAQLFGSTVAVVCVHPRGGETNKEVKKRSAARSLLPRKKRKVGKERTEGRRREWRREQLVLGWVPSRISCNAMALSCCSSGFESSSDSPEG